MLIALGTLVFAPAAGAANPWVRVAAPSPSTELSLLQSVSCVSATECTAVGMYISGSGLKPLAVRTSDGVTWTRQTVPSTTFYTDLRAVDCETATVCTAVGGSIVGPSDGFRFHTLVMRTTNGTTWSRVTVPSPGGEDGAELLSVDCVTATRCRAVGLAGRRSLVLRTGNGMTWFREPSPNRGTGDNVLASIDCVSNVSCTAVGGYEATASDDARGRTLVMRSNGPDWTLVSSPNPAPSLSESVLQGVSCVAPSTCTAVGVVTPAPAGIERAFILRTTNGTTWTRAATPSAGGEVDLESIHCNSATTCTAVGTVWNAAHDRVTTSLLRTTDGTGWASPSPSSERLGRPLAGVFCFTAVSCVGVGAFNTTGNLDDPLKSLVLKET
jgi:hypothetical protein